MIRVAVLLLVSISCLSNVAVYAASGDKNATKTPSRPNDIQYERTFIKYHHRRKIKQIISPDYEDFITDNNDFERFKREFDNSDLEDENKTEESQGQKTDSNVEKRSMEANSKNGLSKNTKDGVKDNTSFKTDSKFKIAQIKKAIVLTSSPTEEAPRHFCLHKYHKVSQSEQISAAVGTHSPSEEKDEDVMASDRVEPPSRPDNVTLEDGTVALVEECANSCYALWMPDDNGTLTILGQGCWQTASQNPGSDCSEAVCAGGPSQLSGAYFCCCRGHYCNKDVYQLEKSQEAPQPPEPSSESEDLPAVSPINAAILSTCVVAILIMLAVVSRTFCCYRRTKNNTDAESAIPPEPGSDALATGLLCVDNVTLIEHIGSGKFGSVWRGSIGGTPVAVKLYSHAAHWQREVDIYSLLSHPNLLKFYGGDSRAMLTQSGARHLLVCELCVCSLRRRLQDEPLSWQQFAELAHGLAAAVAYLHTPQGRKPCVVHRDINSSNVLVGADGGARLADLGLAAEQRDTRGASPAVTEAGTLRYLSPEALEGALDLTGARAALCAVDVFALGLVLWEMLWRTRGAHAGPPPPYAAPYHHAGLAAAPALSQMQALVSRGKVRPPLPRGPVSEQRALKLVADTCDECWDHDAEARLTAVCVEERLRELRVMLQPPPQLVRDNNLHPRADAAPRPGENDKNSNVLNERPCDVTTPLLFAHPHIGRNACLERNTNTNTPAQATLIQKSLKDNPPEGTSGPRLQNIDDNCLSMARTNHRHYQTEENSDRLNEIRSVPRPLDYIPNDVSCRDDRQPKDTNLINDVKVVKPKWSFGRFFAMKASKSVQPLDTEVKLAGTSNNVVQNSNGKIKTSVVVNTGKKSNNFRNGRPSNLTIADDRGYVENPCTLSPPNRTMSPNMMMEPIRSDKIFAFKELPRSDDSSGPKPSQIFAVIVPKAKRDSVNYIEMQKTKGSSESIGKNEASMSSQSLNKSMSVGNSESEDSTVKKGRLSCDDKIITSNQQNSGNSSRASIELHYLTREQDQNYGSNDDSYRSDCSSSIEDENLMLLSENGGSKITMQPIPKATDDSRKKYQNEVLKEASVTKDFGSICNKFPSNGYSNFDNEFSDPNDKENSFSGDNPVYLAAIKGEISTDLYNAEASPKRSKKRECKSVGDTPRSPKPSLKYLAIKRQHSLEQVSEIFSSSGDVSHLQNPAGRVKTPGDLPVAVRRARRDRLQKNKAHSSNRLSLYDDRMMFGNSL